MLDQIMAMLQGGIDPALGATMVNNPEVIGMHLASQGVPPPPPQSPAVQGAPTLESPLDPNTMPMPQPRPAEAPLGPTPPLAGATAADADQGYVPQIGWTGTGGIIDRARQAYGPMIRSGLDRLRTPPAMPWDNPLAPTPQPQTLSGATAADADQGYDPGTPPVVAQGNGGVPMPTARPSSTHFAGAGAPREGTPDAAKGAAQKPSQAQDLLKMMQGIKAPAAPTPQKVSTPGVLRPNQLPANNNLVQLLAAAMGNAPDVKPLLLSSLLGGGRGR